MCTDVCTLYMYICIHPCPITVFTSRGLRKVIQKYPDTTRFDWTFQSVNTGCQSVTSILLILQCALSIKLHWQSACVNVTMAMYLRTLGVGGSLMWILLKAGDCWVDEPPVSSPESGLSGQGEGQSHTPPTHTHTKLRNKLSNLRGATGVLFKTYWYSV